MGKCWLVPSTCHCHVSDAVVTLFKKFSPVSEWLCCWQVLAFHKLPSDQQDRVFMEPSAGRSELDYRALRGVLLTDTLETAFFFFFLIGVHVPEMTNVCVWVHGDVFLNCMTVQTAADLSVVCCLQPIYLYFLNRC